MRLYKYVVPAIVLISTLFCQLRGYAQHEYYICPGDTLRVKAEAMYADHYIWYKDSVKVDNYDSELLIISEPGVYTVLATNNSNCNSAMSWPVVVKQRSLEARFDSAHTSMNTPVDIYALNNDISECWALDSTAINVVRTPIKGTVEIRDGKAIYKPYTNMGGFDSFVYTVKDLAGHISNEATVIVSINMECAIVYPNPAKDIIKVKLLNKDIAYLRLVDGSGQILQKLTATWPLQMIDISSYADGFYVLQLVTADGQTQCLYKVLKRN